MTTDSLISPPASSISPAVSFAKTDSAVSVYNEYLVDVSSKERALKEEANIESYRLQQNQPYLGNGVIDSHIWFPPEPDDVEDDVEDSVANLDDDDDDEYGDGVKWGKPSNLSSLGQEGSASFRFREETRKAMDQVMNGKFKELVDHLLKSMGISCSENDRDNWVDTVARLSWEAASYLKPDAFEGKAMDPDGYVKVKCIASGTQNQSEVFKGLIFKKHAAHKHMPTKCKKPKLLLIKGALSVSSDGLSSFESMKKAGLALACGCTMVIKPSELTPLTALAAVELAIQSGIPPGVLNTVMGDALSIGKALLESPQVMKITFTGSTAVGKKLMAGAAETVKKNSPLYLQQLIIMKISNCSGFQMIAKGSVRHNHLLDTPHSFKYMLPALNTEDPADLSETIPPATTGQKEKKDV